MDEPIETWCAGCVYYPPNLPRSAYAETDWLALQSQNCAYECTPGDTSCRTWRKTSCSLVDLQSL